MRDWMRAPTPPDAIADPWQLDGAALFLRTAEVPGTVAEENADASDWWYRTSFDAEPGRRTLRFDGLATLAQVWLNGERILESDNMFRQYRVDVELRAQNELVLCFRSLDAALNARRPRPRWKTRLVKHQQLRWFRTSLLGRIPGWTPPIPIVGPYRAIAFEERMTDIELRTKLEATTGIVEFSCVAEGAGTLTIGETTVDLRRDGGRLTAQLRIEHPALWWPHTYAAPSLYDCNVTIDGQTVDCGRVGFRTIDVRQNDGDFELCVNGVPLFCRGACWTPGDLSALDALRDAGANMVRVGGTMLYESDAFYDRCDELGILVWQDFMFANMDYPADDAAFVENVRVEATQQVARLRRHPSMAVFCGNSEVEQQAAMLGMPRELWRNAIFAELLPSLCGDAMYVPSSPSGGALPFHASTGVTHYYGVGAYRRPIEDARRANVRFATESLGFANVPSQDVIDEVMEGDAFAAHDPRWKGRTPRDSGSPWDFEDVRDHYLRELYGGDPVQLRSFDPQRYLDLSRVVTGEVMARVYAGWRAGGTCRGALVWFLRDLEPGAGWGILDSRGTPKACFHFLRRAWQPRTVVLTNEGVNGMHAHVVNDTDAPMTATLTLTLLRDGHVEIARAQTGVDVAPRGRVTIEADALFGAFYDTAYAYRFGPPAFDVLIATLSGEAVIAEAFHFPIAKEPQRISGAQVVAKAGENALTITTDRFLYAVHIDVPGFVAADDFFHLAPGTKTIAMRGTGRMNGELTALNLGEAVRIAQ